MAFTALEDVEISHKFVVYCEWGRNVVCLTDNDTHEKVAALPLIDVEETSGPCSIDVWTKPLTKDVYAECLREYAHVLCGKHTSLGNRERMIAGGWTLHRVQK